MSNKKKDTDKIKEDIIQFDTENIMDSKVKVKEPDKKDVEIVKLNEELENQKAMCLRLRADYENLKKRNADISKKSFTDGQMDVVVEFLPLIDTFYRAIELVGDQSSDLLPIKKQLDSIMENLNIKEIKALGEEFDPNYHNAVMQCEDADNCGKVVEVFDKGYTFKDKILRYSVVKVAK